MIGVPSHFSSLARVSSPSLGLDRSFLAIYRSDEVEAVFTDFATGEKKVY